MLEINEKKDAEQDNELHEQAVKDKEHDAKILELQERIKELEGKGSIALGEILPTFCCKV